MGRHVAYIEGHGEPSPERIERQHAIIDAVAREYRPLPDGPPRRDRGEAIAGFAFSTRTTAPEAVARLVAILDSVDADWRSHVRVWDGWVPDGSPSLSEPPQEEHGAALLRAVAELLGRIFTR